MRSGGDAGTAIHTSVPFGIAATMAAVSIHCGEDIGRRRVEPLPDKKEAPWQATRRQTRTGSRE